MGNALEDVKNIHFMEVGESGKLAHKAVEVLGGKMMKDAVTAFLQQCPKTLEPVVDMRHFPD